MMASRVRPHIALAVELWLCLILSVLLRSADTSEKVFCMTPLAHATSLSFSFFYTSPSKLAEFRSSRIPAD